MAVYIKNDEVITGTIIDATTTHKGKVRFATDLEAEAGTIENAVINPKQLKEYGGGGGGSVEIPVIALTNSSGTLSTSDNDKVKNNELVLIQYGDRMYLPITKKSVNARYFVSNQIESDGGDLNGDQVVINTSTGAYEVRHNKIRGGTISQGNIGYARGGDVYSSLLNKQDILSIEDVSSQATLTMGGSLSARSLSVIKCGPIGLIKLEFNNKFEASTEMQIFNSFKLNGVVPKGIFVSNLYVDNNGSILCNCYGNSSTGGMYAYGGSSSTSSYKYTFVAVFLI